MASKRDQLQAHQFSVQRVISALVTRESDPEQPPFRRPSVSAIGSIVLAVIALGGTAVYGLLNPGGNDRWRDGESVIVVEETGTRYVYLDGRLHPVRNYASALLALEQHAETMSVSQDSLVDVPRGPLIGIPGAPDALPGTERALDAGWSMCSRTAEDPAGQTVDETVLLVGERPRRRLPLLDRALLLEVERSGDQYLVWRGYRHQIREPDTVTVGLALQTEPNARVGTELLDTLPEGEAISPIDVKGVGKTSRAVPRRDDILVGQVLAVETPGGGVQHYLAEAERLRPISALQFAIQLAHEPTTKAYDGAEPAAVQLGPVAATEAAKAPAAEYGPGAPPRRRPHFVDSGRNAPNVCTTYEDGAGAPEVHVAATLPSGETLISTEGTTENGTPMADRTYVPPGYVSIVEAMPSHGADSGTLLVVTDQGRAYTVADPAVLDQLGYRPTDAVRLPASLVARVPLGPGLNTQAARSAAPPSNAAGG